LAATGQFHVITAYNPGDARPDPSANEAADLHLHQELVAAGLAPVRALGSDPDSEHREPSWAVAGLTDVQARAIGATHGQVAVFRIARHEQTVLACTQDWRVSRPLACPPERRLRRRRSPTGPLGPPQPRDQLGPMSD
jgi:hypothetical protein